MNNLQIFNNPEFGDIRTVKIDGEPWFVGKDIAEALGYTNPRDAVKNHVDPEDKGVAKHDTPGGLQKISIINESGLYSLILSSKLPNARKFKRWVTSEVLPAIRKTGHYETPGYTPKATSVGEVVNLIKITKETMKEQGATPSEVAEAVKSICDQFGVSLPDSFVKPKETTMTDVMDMIDYIFAQPRGRGHRRPTYEEFLIHQANTKRLGGRR
ncbi:MAG: Bro-N domain-containing protein [Clostridium sp.]|nr:Bro-N domain-containing protein [Clostridium sp.]